MVKNIFKILSLRVVAPVLLLTVLSSNTFVIAQYICSHQMEQTEEGCCCHQNKNINTNDNAKLTRSDCGCCITQGQPVDNSLPPVTITTNNLIQDHQYVQSDINIQNFYITEFNINESITPLIIQDINILNANLRI